MYPAAEVMHQAQPVPMMAPGMITCISCGQHFPFNQTVEGRCLRDHALHSEREQLKMAVLTRNNAQAPVITITGPTVTNNNSSSAAASAATVQRQPLPVIWYNRNYYGCSFISWMLIIYCIVCAIAMILPPVIISAMANAK